MPFRASSSSSIRPKRADLGAQLAHASTEPIQLLVDAAQIAIAWLSNSMMYLIPHR